MASKDLDTYLKLIIRLSRCRADLEKRKIGKELTELLRSESVSVRRSVKYKLRDLFPLPADLVNTWSKWGPPEEGEVLYWKSYFK